MSSSAGVNVRSKHMYAHPSRVCTCTHAPRPHAHRGQVEQLQAELVEATGKPAAGGEEESSRLRELKAELVAARRRVAEQVRFPPAWRQARSREKG